MANTPISGFASGAPAQAGDEFVIARSGANFKLASSDIKTLIIGAGSVSIASGKTFTSSNTLTLAGTDGTTMTFPSTSATIARTDAGNTFTGAQTFSVGTVNGTGLDISQTWTGTGTYTGLKYNVGTDSGPSNAASLLLDLQVGGVSKLTVGKDGATFARARLFSNVEISAWNTGVTIPTFWANTTSVNSTVGYGFSSGYSVADLILTRANTATLQLGAADAAAPVAQTLLIQSGSGTDINGVAFNIGGSKSTGTGTAGLVNIQTSSRGAASGTSQNVLATVASFGPNTLSGSQAISLLDMAQTWNTSGTPTAIKLNVTDTASNAASLLLDLQVGGTSKFRVGKDGAIYNATMDNFLSVGVSNITLKTNTQPIIFTTATGYTPFAVGYVYAQLGGSVGLGWTNSAYGATGTADTILTRDGQPNTLALKNAGNAQIFRVYSTTASSGSYGIISAGVQPDGSTAQADTLYIGSAGANTAMTKLALVQNGTTRLYVDANGNLNTSGDTAYSFGTGIRTVEINGSTSGFNTAQGGLTFKSKTGSNGANAIYCAGGAMSFYAGSTTFAAMTEYLILSTTGLLQFQGTSSSFPALKRTPSSASLQVRLADDTAFAPLSCGNTTASGTALDVSGTGAASIFNVVNTTTGTLLSVVNSSSATLFSVADTPAITLIDAMTIAVGTTTGTKIGTSTSQKLGFFDAMPVVQQAVTTDLLDSIQALGLVASGAGDTPLNLSGGALTCGAITTAGNMLFTDNAYDIGAAAVTRPRTIYASGGVSHAAPSTKTGDYSQGANDYSLIFNGTGSITLTLLAAATYPGKILYVKTIAAQTVVSASSNVKPIDNDTAGTAILAATAGKWAMLQSDGTNWVIMAQG